MPRNQTIFKIIKNASKSDLEEFILALAENDSRIEKKIQIHFSDYKDNLKKIEDEIYEIILDCSDEYDSIDYFSSYDFEARMKKLIKKTFPELIKKKDAKASFEAIKVLFFELGSLDFDNSDVYVYELMVPVMKYFKKNVKLMNEAEREECFDWLEDHLNDGKIESDIGHCIYDAYTDFFNDKKSLENKMKFFDKYLEENYFDANPGHYDSMRRVEKYALNRISCMEKLKFSEDEILTFCRKYEKIDEISNRATDILLSRKQYDEAEKIYLKKIEEKGLRNDFTYKEKLLELYRLTNDIKKLKRILREVIFHGGVDFDYYREYKSLFSESEWKKELDSLLKIAKYASDIEEILFEEKMMEELFNFICKQYKSQPVLYSVIAAFDKYGKYFDENHSAEILEIYSGELGRRMNAASNRNMYSEVASKLKDLMKFKGGKEKALELKRNWFEKYKNRSAMKDELNRIL